MAGQIPEYVQSLIASERFSAQIVYHRVLEPEEAATAEPRRPLPSALARALKAQGVEALYAHQALALDHVRAGRHLVAATPTASGKSLIYNLPVMEQCLRDPDSKALYLFPLKALAQDQLGAFKALAGRDPDLSRITAAIYDGDTTPYRRSKIRQSPPNVVMSNPDMLHLSMLPHHGSWAPFLAGLTHVVVDEVHTYRGVMGSHMAMVFKRLMRVCAYYGSRPTFVFCSATVGNPEELCSNLSGLEVAAVTRSGAPTGRRHMLFLNPHDSPASAAIGLLKSALARNLKTIVYTQSRKMTELIAIWASEKAGKYKGRISAYRAGFLPEERREIEARMASGELLAVISTSALELGIDIGGLDLCLLVGYPGTVMQTLQRGGRVGRARQDSAVALIAQQDALDQYFMRHPEDFFARPAEPAVLNPDNEVIMDRHLVCAAAELGLRLDEPFALAPAVRAGIRRLADRGELFMNADDTEALPHRKRPHREVDLRGAGRSLNIMDTASGESIGMVDQARAMKETHPGAVYLHWGKTYLVESLDLNESMVRAAPARVGFYTRTRGEKSTEILSVEQEKQVGGTSVRFGKLRVTERITGFERRNTSGGALLTVVPLDLPPLVFETEGLWIDIPDKLRRMAEDEFLHFMGAIHAMEHAAIGMLPLTVLADRNDLGGISTPMHPQTRCSAVFVYDALPGGAGLTRQAFATARDLLSATLAAIRDCPCELGCPSCVHSPKCGSGNRPMDKQGAAFLLSGILDNNELQHTPTEIPVDKPDPAQEAPQAPAVIIPKHFAVLDIETRRSAQEVGGWHRADRMGVSIAVLYDSKKDALIDYPQEEIPELVQSLPGFERVIGFNIIRFDYKVLSGLVPFDYGSLPTTDLLLKVHERLGYRLKLDNLAKATLGAGKSADGLQALKWWQEGRLDLITEYCRQDVVATRDLYLHALNHGHVLFTNKAHQRVKLPIAW